MFLMFLTRDRFTEYLHYVHTGIWNPLFAPSFVYLYGGMFVHNKRRRRTYYTVVASYMKLICTFITRGIIWVG